LQDWSHAACSKEQAYFARAVSYALKMSMKLIPEVNFTNILRDAFCTKVFCAAFMCLQFGFVIFWQKDFGAKAAHKMFMKLIPGG
jgi:hypothetical protein